MPLDWNLCDGNAQLFGQEQEFHVEYPGGKMLSWKYLLCSRTREQLEAALCIPDMSNTDDPEDGVQAVHENIAKKRALSGEKVR